MTTEKMTVHKALAELKVMDSRIEKAMANAHFVVANKHSNEKIMGFTVASFKDQMKSDYQKATDLINRRSAIKKAVVLSNAQTMVTIGGETYSVAEAIEMKNHGMDYWKSLLNIITNQYEAAQRVLIQNSGDAIEKKAENYVLTVIQAQPKDSKMAVDSDAMKALRKDYIANNVYDLIDPNDIAKKMNEISTMIDEFTTEIDSALSVSNALTVIEFSY